MKRGNNKGFTLLEVLLAVSILAVVSAMVGYAIKTSVTTLEATRNRKDAFRQARVAFERIADDLAGVTVDGDFIGKSLEIEGKSADTIRFHSSSHIQFVSSDSKDGIAEISYEVVADESNPPNLKLIRADALALPGIETGDEGSTGYTLCENLVGVSFAFVGPDGQKTDTWEEGDREKDQADEPILPRGVYISLEYMLDPDWDSTIIFESAVWLPGVVIQGKQERDAKDAGI